jgi:hypothetical protein
MTTEAARLARIYVVASSILIFVIIWSVVGADARAVTKTAQTTAQDPRLTRLTEREQAFNVEAARARALIDSRWAQYKKTRAQRLTQIANVRKANASVRARNAALAAQPTYSYGASSSGGGGGSAATYAPSAPSISITPAPAPSTSTSSS